MVFRLEIGLKQGVTDARGQETAAKAGRDLGLDVAGCTTRIIYKIEAPLAPEAQQIVQETFTDPVIAESAWGRLAPPSGYDWLIEVGFKPGVTDNVGRTAAALLHDLLVPEPLSAQVYTATQYFLQAPTLPAAQVEQLASDLLANSLIQSIRVYTRKAWENAPVDVSVPAIGQEQPVEVKTYDLSGNDDDLMRISREGILSLSLDEMHAIRDYFAAADVRAQRTALGLPVEPTDVELECIAQTWSEHCSHKIFAGDIRYTNENGRVENIHSLFKTYIKASTERIANDRDWLVSVFTDNAGIIRFNERLNLAYKVETHNSPSALDPYGGAITGIVGVNRDPMGAGMGCNLLCNVWGYCLASPFYQGVIPTGLFHPRRIRDGVHQGVIDGGNQSGIPWMRGFECFDERYLGKPLVYCGTLGTIPVEVAGSPSERQQIIPGDLLVMTGGLIGKDGIHGATFSSEELRQESPAQAVQIGDPITQRKMYDFLMEARDQGLYRCITDNGAGGLSCSVGEMGLFSGGVEIDLAKAPLKYAGLQPWEIFLSEAQERMTLAVAPEKIDAFLELAQRRDVVAVALGTFTDSGKIVVRHGERVVGCLGMDFLYKTGCPTMRMEARWEPPVMDTPEPCPAGRRDDLLLELLADLNICSREFKSRMYDSEVKGLSVVKPFIGVHSDTPADATVMRVEYGNHQGVVLAEGINPFYSDLDAYHMAASVIDEAVRRIISAGGALDRIAGLDNFCWPDPVLSDKTPDGPYKLAQLVRANQAIYDLTTTYKTPCVSGKDSMKNDSVRGGRKISIPPTLLFSAIGIIDDVRRAVTMALKQAGDLLYVAGLTHDERGASAFHRLLAARQGRPEACGGSVPRVRPEEALKLYAATEQAHAQGVLQSSHTPTRGGLGVALGLVAVGGDLGLDVNLGAVPCIAALDPDALLFSESNSRFLLSCKPEDAPQLERIFGNMPLRKIGRVTDTGRLIIHGPNNEPLIDTAINDLRDAFKGTLAGI